MAKTPRKPAAKTPASKAKTTVKTSAKSTAKPSAKSKAQPAKKPAVKAASAPAKAPAVATPQAPTKPQVVQPAKELAKKDLLERLVAQTGAPRNQVKKIMEATLAELGDAIQRGDAINMAPLGKLSVNRSKEVENAHIFITKLRRSKSMLAARKRPNVVAQAVPPAPKRSKS